MREGVVPQTYWAWQEVGSTRNAKQELSKIMEAGSGEDLFITPKPTQLIKRMLQIATNNDSLVLDFLQEQEVLLMRFLILTMKMVVIENLYLYSCLNLRSKKIILLYLISPKSACGG